MQFFITIVTGLFVKCSRCLLHPYDFTLHLIDVFHMLFHFFVIFVYAFHLCLQLTHQKLFDDFKTKYICFFLRLKRLRFFDSDVIFLAVGLF